MRFDARRGTGAVYAGAASDTWPATGTMPPMIPGLDAGAMRLHFARHSLLASGSNICFCSRARIPHTYTGAALARTLLFFTGAARRDIAALLLANDVACLSLHGEICALHEAHAELRWLFLLARCMRTSLIAHAVVTSISREDDSFDFYFIYALILRRAAHHSCLDDQPV